VEGKYANIYRVSLVAEPKNIKDYDDHAKLTKYVTEAIKKGGMTLKSIIVDVLHGEYKGISLVAVISESHVALYTFKEHNSIYIDIATCSDESSIRSMINHFKKVFIIKNENEINIIKLG
jgi:S-adenosylmethionine/arginine decarboxylase-like enzyme